MPCTNVAPPIMKILGRGARPPLTIASTSHVLVTRADHPCLPVAACGARGPFTKPHRGRSFEDVSQRVRESNGDEWILSLCRRCCAVVDAYVANHLQRRDS